MKIRYRQLRGVPSVPHIFRRFCDVYLPLLFGISMGFLISGIFSALMTDEISKHNIQFSHEDEVKETNEVKFLRCIIIITPLPTFLGILLPSLMDYNPNNPKLTKNITLIINSKKSPPPMLRFNRKSEDIFTQFPYDPNKTFALTRQEYVEFYTEERIIRLQEAPSAQFHWKYYQQVLGASSQPPAQWTLVANEETFMVIGNLWSLLNRLDSSVPQIIGRIFTPRNPLSWLYVPMFMERVEIQAGVVLSHSAINALVDCDRWLLPRSTDTALYWCAESEGITLIDPVDEANMHLFHYMDLKSLIPESFERASEKSNIEEADVTAECCSDHAISFGRLTFKEIRTAHFATSSWKVFGRGGAISNPNLFLPNSTSNSTTKKPVNNKKTGVLKKNVVNNTKLKQEKAAKINFNQNGKLSKKDTAMTNSSKIVHKVVGG